MKRRFDLLIESDNEDIWTLVNLLVRRRKFTALVLELLEIYVALQKGNPFPLYAKFPWLASRGASVPSPHDDLEGDHPPKVSSKPVVAAASRQIEGAKRDFTPPPDVTLDDDLDLLEVKAAVSSVDSSANFRISMAMVTSDYKWEKAILSMAPSDVAYAVAQGKLPAEALSYG